MSTTLLRRSLCLAFTLVVLTCFCGCQSKTPTAAEIAREEEQIEPREKLVVDPDARVADVPVPLGAHFKPDSSSSYETGSRRRIAHNYGIWAKSLLVRKFYRDNMPMHGWRLTNTITSQGTYYMSYRKGPESCRVGIGPTNWFLQTRIEIIIQPVDGFD